MTSIPESVPDDARSKKSVADAFVLFLVSLFLFVTIGRFAQSVSVTFGVFLNLIVVILVPALIYVRLKRLPIAKSLRWRPVRAGIALRCVILGCLGLAIMSAIYLLTIKPVEAVIGVDPWADFWFQVMPTTVPELFIFVLAMAILPALCEESLFSGAILGILEKKGPWKAIICTALLVAVYHMDPWRFLPFFASGMLFGLVTIRTNSTLSAMICHASSNALAFILSFLFRKDDPHDWPYLLIGVGAVLFVLVLIEFLHHTRNTERQTSPLTTAPDKLSARLKWTVAGVIAVLVILVLVVFNVFLHGYYMSTDHPEADIQSGDWFIILDTRYIHADIQPGDVVVIEQGDAMFLRKLVRIDGGIAWVVEKQSETELQEVPISRQDITGKIVYKFSFSK